MAVWRGGFGDPCLNMAIPFLENQTLPLLSSDSLNSLFNSSSSPSFLGSRSMVSFEDINGGKRSLYRAFNQEENGEEDLEDYFHQPEKKRRLTVDQVQFLEKSFESDNKLEPDRKFQLAKDLGLQPRQVAIWFQNRRARWKTRQLEKDYESLQSSYNSLKADHDNLHKEKEKLKAEVIHLTDKLNHKVKDNENSDFSDTNGESKALPQELVVESASEGEVSKLTNMAFKQDDLSSSKSDVADSESPHCIYGGHSSFIERGDSSYAFEPEQSSDQSQDEEDNLSLLPPTCYGFHEVEDAANSCYFGFPLEDNAFGFWS